MSLTNLQYLNKSHDRDKSQDLDKFTWIRDDHHKSTEIHYDLYLLRSYTITMVYKESSFSIEPNPLMTKGMENKDSVFCCFSHGSLLTHELPVLWLMIWT